MIVGERFATRCSTAGLTRFESSRFTFEQTLEYAQRAEVTVYAIGLGLEGRGQRDARKVLRRFAEVTGGRGFFIEDVATLAGVYTSIQQELRAKYLLAYQSDNPDDTDTFRQIRVDVTERGLEAKTIRGYYP